MTMGPSARESKKHIPLAEVFLRDSQVVTHNLGGFRSAADRTYYYAVHHAAVALLVHYGVRPPKSHRGLLSQFGLEIANKGRADRTLARTLSDAFQIRSTSTYGTNPSPTEAQFATLIVDIKKCVRQIKTLVEKDN